MMMKTVAALLLVLLAGGAFAYDCKLCDGDMCCNIPGNHQYYLTDFCGGAGTMACGRSCGYTRYYTADRQRFGCGATLKICGRGKCVSASVQDAGPANWVENDAGMPIIDSSVPTCEYFTGSSSCGWSDRILITAVVAGSASKPVEDGPIKVTHAEYLSFVGNATYQREIAEGWIDPSKPLPWGEQEKLPAQQQPAAPACCAPDQSTSFSFSWDERRHWRAGVNVSYDYTNQRVAMYIGAHDHLLAELVDFKTKTAVTVDFTSKTCHTTKVEHSMEKDCVPEGATPAQKYKVAGQMPATLYEFHLPDGGEGYEQRSDANCATFQSVFVDERFGAMVTETLDWKTGVNAGAFTPPSFCKSSTSSSRRDTSDLVSAPGRELHRTGSVRSALALVHKLAEKQ